MENSVDARAMLRRAFGDALAAGDPRYAADPRRCAADARAVETACYNAAIRICKGSDDFLARRWASPAFVNVYSGRCGAVLPLLDPGSAPCRAYGAALAAQIFDGVVRPDAVGAMSERELCPAASAAERDEIAARAAQRVDVKESSMFQCPHCRARRCTYQAVQRRALDEAADYVCVCLAPGCGRRFTGRS